MKSIVKHAFNDICLFKISAEIEKWNIAMEKVLKKVGFKQDAYFTKARVKKIKELM